MKFKKMHGLGNDFIIIDGRDQRVSLTTAQMTALCDRRRGVGCDLITIIAKPDKSSKADIRVRFFNADGSESGACGNATRCVADIIMTEAGRDSCMIAVNDGVLHCRKAGDLMVEVDMGAPILVNDIDLSYGGVSNPVTVDMGNPHCVFFVYDLDDIDVATIGAYVETHEMFPDRTNVEFVQVNDRSDLRQKTWERGVGITEACGSGACAVAAAAIHRGLSDHKVEIALDGGVLTIEQRASDQHMLMTGSVAYVFEGVI